MLSAGALLTAASQGQAGGGLPISSCGQTVTQNAFLTADLFCQFSSGIVVGASGITIDLKGHTLSGNRTAGHHGIDDTGGFDRVTVKNGVLTHFYIGVFGTAVSGSADEVSVSGVVASGNVVSGVTIVGTSSVVQSTTASGNSEKGIELIGDSVTVKSSSVHGNAHYGIDVYGASARIESSTASGNGDHGIQVDGIAPRIKGNRAEANGFGSSDFFGFGILAKGWTTAPVGKNIARGNDDPVECDPVSLC